eukprot:7244029-Alexandrium_andersonii.AAC.1
MNHQAGRDGRAPFERLFDKPCCDEGLEFGELVHFRARPTQTTVSMLGGRWLFCRGRRWGPAARVVALAPGDV